MKNKKLSRVILGVVFATIILSGALYFYLNKGHRNPADEKAEKVTPSVLYQSLYQQNNKVYIDKTIEMTGKIKEVEESNKKIVLSVPENSDATITVGLSENMQFNPGSFKVDQEVSLIGICKGINADSSMGEIIMVDILIRDGQILKK